MKARSAARELALIALFQLDQKNGKLDWEKSSWEDILVDSVRTLTTLAQEQLETVGGEIATLKDFLVDSEILHPDNENIPVDRPTQPVPIPTTREMIEQLDALLRAIENLQEALTLPELKALGQREDVQNFCFMLIRKVQSNQAAIDARINNASQDWRVERLQKMDLYLLRLAVAELVYTHHTDTATVIDEALELANRFTMEESRKFIHGILGAIAQSLEETPEAEENRV